MASTTPATEPTKEPQQLLQEEVDDEFEEFPVENWEDKDTFAATLNNHAGSQKTGLQSLWDDTWDDDDVQDDFSVQLKAELEKAGQMQT